MCKSVDESGDDAESWDMESLIEVMKKLFDKEKAEKGELERGLGRLAVEGMAKDERIKRLEHEVKEMRDFAENQPVIVLNTKTEQSGEDAVGSGDLGKLRQEIKDLRTRLDKEKAEKGELKRDKKRLEVEGKDKDEQIKSLEQENEDLRGTVESQTKLTQEAEEKLTKTEGLLATRSAEFNGSRAFLSTKDRLSEAEVLGIVRDLNENIYQVSVKLTEEWEKFESSRKTTKKDAGPTPPPTRVIALVRLVHEQDPTSIAFLLQMRLCTQALNITSSWSRYRDFAVLDSVYKRLSASGEHHIVDVG